MFQQYAVDALLSTVLFYLIGLVSQKKSFEWKTFGILVGVGVLATVSSHPAIFTLASIGIFLCALWVTQELPVRLTHLAIAGFTWLVLFGANYLFILTKLGENPDLTNYWQNGFLLFPFTKEGIDTWMHVLTKFLHFHGYGSHWHVLVISLCFIAMVDSIVNKRFPYLVIIGVFLITICAALLGKYPIYQRMSLFLFPFMVFLMIRGLDLLTRDRSKVITIVFATLLFLPSVNGLSKFTLKPIYKEELRPMIQLMQEKRDVSEPVYVYYGAVNALNYYYRNTPKEGTFIQGLCWRKDHSLMHQEIERLSKLPKVWVIFSHIHKKEESIFINAMKKAGAKVEERYDHYNAALYLLSH